MDTIQFFPTDITYKEKDNRVTTLLFGRLLNGENICFIDDNFLPYFYIKLKKGSDESHFKDAIKGIAKRDKDKIHSIVSAEIINKRFLEEDISVIKVNVNVPTAVKTFREIFKHSEDVGQVLETNVLFTKRYLIDHNITPFVLHEAIGSEASFRTRCKKVLRLEKIEPREELYEKPRMLALDIETYNPGGEIPLPSEFPILMISLYSENFRKVLTWKRFETENDYIEFYDSESDMLQRFKELVNGFDPDIISGYFSDGFDLPYIKTRAQKYNIEMNFGLDHSGILMRSKGARIKGRNHIDVYKFIKHILGGSLDLDHFDLDSVAFKLLGTKKKKVEIEKLAQIWDNEVERIEEFCEYNLQDSKLVYDLSKKVLPNILEFVKLIRLTPYEICRMYFSQYVEHFIICQAFDQGNLVPNKHISDDDKSFQGGFVYEPKPGLYDNIAVFDFRSLYPTIITSHNISPGALNYPCGEEEKIYAPLEGKNYWFCKSRKGFIPKILEDLISRRMRINEMLKSRQDKFLKARAYSLKILANSFYGYFTYPMSRWYSLECAESITAWGRHYIKEVIAKAEQAGYDILYSDTDSVFLALKEKTKEDISKFIEEINIKLPGLMELEFEGFYKRGIFVGARSSKTGQKASTGAKKKYALLCEDKTIKIVGFESVRRNWSFIAKDLQEAVIGLLLTQDDKQKALDFVLKIIERLKNKQVPIESLIIFTQLQKKINSYETIGPHVAVARRMQDMGLDVEPGTMIKYIIIPGDKRISDRARLPEEIDEGEYDPEYYINHQIIPAVEKLFEVVGIDIEEEIKGKDQSKLNKYF